MKEKTRYLILEKEFGIINIKKRKLRFVYVIETDDGDLIEDDLEEFDIILPEKISNRMPADTKLLVADTHGYCNIFYSDSYIECNSEEEAKLYFELNNY